MSNEALDKAVIELSGVWPSASDCSNKLSILAYTLYTDGPSEIKFKEFGTIKRDQFTQRAKELGFIGKYRWGVEYPTNGKRPELKFMTVIEVKRNDCLSWDSIQYMIGDEDMSYVTHFKITDPALKPASSTASRIKSRAARLLARFGAKPPSYRPLEAR